MFYVYLMKSDKGRWYIGSTKDLRRRIDEHRSGKNFSTKYSRNWKLMYYEAYINELYARDREKKLKSFGSAFGHLLKRTGLKRRGEEKTLR